MALKLQNLGRTEDIRVCWSVGHKWYNFQESVCLKEWKAPGDVCKTWGLNSGKISVIVLNWVMKALHTQSKQLLSNSCELKPKQLQVLSLCMVFLCSVFASISFILFCFVINWCKGIWSRTAGPWSLHFFSVLLVIASPLAGLITEGQGSASWVQLWLSPTWPKSGLEPAECQILFLLCVLWHFQGSCWGNFPIWITEPNSLLLKELPA